MPSFLVRSTSSPVRGLWRTFMPGILLALGCLTGHAQAHAPSAMVRTDAGDLLGTATASGTAFLGVPFAAPPVGDLRWRAPQPVTPWPGVRMARVAAPTCMQDPRIPPAGVGNNSEDCLYLNVHVPASASTAGPLPVMVWIHGGAFINGAGSQYDGTVLAHEAQAVVVTVNYRLGIFGSLALDALAAEAKAGNYALQDQQAALRWVQRNIGAFGGDARRVTIFGESAGGTSVCNQLISPAAKGLFQRAIIQSGTCPSVQPTRAQAVAVGKAYADRLGCVAGAAQLACLRSKSALQALAASPDIDAADPASLGQFSPHIDGVVLPEAPRTAIRAGRFHQVPVLLGNNADEGTLFIALAFELQRGTPMTEAELQAMVKGNAGDSGLAALASSIVLEAYRPSRYGSPNLAAAALLGDSLFACPTQFLARALSDHVPTYVYEFQEKNAPVFVNDPFMPWGAFHASELPFVFGTRIVTTPPSPDPAEVATPAQKALSKAMMAYWGRFAATGQPNVSGQKAWPRFNRLLQATQTFKSQGIGTELLGVPYVRHQCLLWDATALLGSMQ
jgi:para-nitrobenzyl esterase